MSLEEEFDIEIPTEDTENIDTIGDIEAYLEKDRKKIKNIGVLIMKSRICEMLKIEYPIFQGAMAWIANASLAAAVSEAGGLGLLQVVRHR